MPSSCEQHLPVGAVLFSPEQQSQEIELEELEPLTETDKPRVTGSSNVPPHIPAVKPKPRGAGQAPV